MAWYLIDARVAIASSESTAVATRCMLLGDKISPYRAIEATLQCDLQREALSQTVKCERNSHLAEPPSDASPGGVVRTHRAIEADSEAAPIRPYNNEICM